MSTKVKSVSGNEVVLIFLEKGVLTASNMRVHKTSDSEFWLEGPYGFLTVKFHVDEGNRYVLYDVFSPKYDAHLKEEALRDVEKLDMIVEEKGGNIWEETMEKVNPASGFRFLGIPLRSLAWPE